METRLKVLTWPDYVKPQTLEQFESEMGIAVELDIVPSAIELLERMQSTGSSVDVLVPPDYAVRELHSRNRLLLLDHARLPNLQHLEPYFYRGRAHDPESRVSVIKDWGTTGFMYRTDKIDETLQSWADFWRLSEAWSGRWSGRVTVLDSPGEVLGAALKKRGHSYNASGSSALAEAREDLLSLKPHLLAFQTDYKPLIASGEAYLSLGWNGDAAALVAHGVPIRYVIPSEGSQLWEDDWAIAAGTSHPDLAQDFLNFMLRPDVAAQEARYTRYATGNGSAKALLDEAMRNDPATYPPPEVLANLEYGMPIDADGQKRREEVWRQVRG